MPPIVLSGSTLTGDDIVNTAGDKLGTLKEIMIDFEPGKVAYGVLARGGVAGIGEKLFAVPWSLFRVDPDRHELVLDLDEEVFDDSPGFDPDNWPQFSDLEWGADVHQRFGVDPYWADLPTDSV
jgi:hypothetical protein